MWYFDGIVGALDVLFVLLEEDASVRPSTHKMAMKARRGVALDILGGTRLESGVKWHYS